MKSSKLNYETKIYKFSKNSNLKITLQKSFPIYIIEHSSFSSKIPLNDFECITISSMFGKTRMRQKKRMEKAIFFHYTLIHKVSARARGKMHWTINNFPISTFKLNKTFSVFFPLLFFFHSIAAAFRQMRSLFCERQKFVILSSLNAYKSSLLQNEFVKLMETFFFFIALFSYPKTHPFTLCMCVCVWNILYTERDRVKLKAWRSF